MSTPLSDVARRALLKSRHYLDRERNLIIECETVGGKMSTLCASAKQEVKDLDETIRLIDQAIRESSAPSANSVVKGS